MNKIQKEYRRKIRKDSDSSSRISSTKSDKYVPEVDDEELGSP